MVRKFISDLVSGVRDGVAWGICFVAWPPSHPARMLLDVVAQRTSSPSDDIASRVEKKRAELAAKNRYGRFLDLTNEETDRWATDDALRAACTSAAQHIADAFGTPITILACNGLELAIVDPTMQVLEHRAS